MRRGCLGGTSSNCHCGFSSTLHVFTALLDVGRTLGYQVGSALISTLKEYKGGAKYSFCFNFHHPQGSDITRTYMVIVRVTIDFFGNKDFAMNNILALFKQKIIEIVQFYTHITQGEIETYF